MSVNLVDLDMEGGVKRKEREGTFSSSLRSAEKSKKSKYARSQIPKMTIVKVTMPLDAISKKQPMSHY